MNFKLDQAASKVSSGLGRGSVLLCLGELVNTGCLWDECVSVWVLPMSLELHQSASGRPVGQASGSGMQAGMTGRQKVVLVLTEFTNVRGLMSPEGGVCVPALVTFHFYQAKREELGCLYFT